MNNVGKIAIIAGASVACVAVSSLVCAIADENIRNNGRIHSLEHENRTLKNDNEYLKRRVMTLESSRDEYRRSWLEQCGKTSALKVENFRLKMQEEKK